MNSDKEQQPFLESFTRSVSQTRFAAFQKADTPCDGLARYLWNIALCEALYPAFNTLEIAFRNAIHRELGAALQSPEWLLIQHPILKPNEVDSIRKAQASLRRHHKPISEPRLVAELSFGFWTSLLDRRYDQHWPGFIAKAFPQMPRRIRTRSNLSAMAQPIRKLRNLAFHHHAIWDIPDLGKTHNTAITLIGWISSPLAISLGRIDRFPSVWGAGLTPYLAQAKNLSPN